MSVPPYRNETEAVQAVKPGPFSVSFVAGKVPPTGRRKGEICRGKALPLVRRRIRGAVI